MTPGELPLTFEYAAGLVVSLALTIYLAFSLLYPERF